MSPNFRSLRPAGIALAALVLTGANAGVARAQGAGAGGGGGSDQLFGWVRPQESNQPSKLATLRIDLSGGADRNPERTDQADLPPEDYAGTLAGSARYWSGRTDQFLELAGSAWGSYQRLASDTLLGADATAQVAREIGQRMGFTVSALGAYRPSLVFGGFGALVPEGDPSVSVVTHPQGVITQRWLVLEGTTSFFRDWTSRQRSNIEVNLNHQRPSEGIGLRSRSQAVQARHEWAFRERAALLFAYRFSENQQSGTAAIRPIRLQAATAGLRLEHRATRSRNLTLTLAAGPTIASLPARDAAPSFSNTSISGFGMLQWSLSPNWAVTGEGSRYVSALDGLTPEPFTTDTGTVTFGGTVGERYSLSLIGVASRGAALNDSTASFSARNATAQFQYAVARRWVLFGSYTYYQHRLRDLVDLAVAFPRSYDRHSLRVGLSLGVPLYRGR